MPDFLAALLAHVSWPFTVRPSLENLTDPNMRHSLAVALSQLGLGMLLLTIAAVVRKGRLVAGLVMLVLAASQGPSLILLLVPATPASYRLSPTGFSTAAIVEGRQVFATNCTPCHGLTGDGAGGLGAIADLRQSHIWSHPIGDLFWFVSHGIDGAPAMPAFDTVLPEHARWSVIDYVHALNAGAVTRGLDGWPEAVLAPSVSLSCARLTARDLTDLRGSAVRLVLGAVTEPMNEVAPVHGIAVVTVWLPGPDAEAAPKAGIDCVGQSGADASAYAVLAGAADGQVIPARFLIDPKGVLRSVWRKGDGEAWADPARQLEEIEAICTESLSADAGVSHEHHH